MYFAGLHRSHKQRTARVIVFPQRHLTWVFDASPEFDGKTGRQSDALQWQVGRRDCRADQGKGKTDEKAMCAHDRSSQRGCADRTGRSPRL
jgi:hypothetical protein